MWLAAVTQFRLALLAGVALLVATGCCCPGDIAGVPSPHRPCRLLPRLFSGCRPAAEGFGGRPGIALAALENPLSPHADALPSPRRRWFHPAPTKPVFGPLELPSSFPAVPIDAAADSAPLLESAPHAQLVAPDQLPPLPEEISDAD